MPFEFTSFQIEPLTDEALVLALDHDPIVDKIELELVVLVVRDLDVGVDGYVDWDLDPIGPLIQHFDVVLGAVVDTVRSRFRLVDVRLELDIGQVDLIQCL